MGSLTVFIYSRNSYLLGTEITFFFFLQSLELALNRLSDGKKNKDASWNTLLSSFRGSGTKSIMMGCKQKYATTTGPAVRQSDFLVKNKSTFQEAACNCKLQAHRYKKNPKSNSGIELQYFLSRLCLEGTFSAIKWFPVEFKSCSSLLLTYLISPCMLNAMFYIMKCKMYLITVENNNNTKNLVVIQSRESERVSQSVLTGRCSLSSHSALKRVQDKFRSPLPLISLDTIQKSLQSLTE